MRFYLQIESSPRLPFIVVGCKEVNVTSGLIMAPSNKGTLDAINIEMTLFCLTEDFIHRVDGRKRRCTQIKEETNKFNNRSIR